MRPIPKCLLIHSATLKKPTGTDEFQNKTYNEILLSFVRFEPVTQTRKTKDNTEGALSGTMYYDRVNSQPRGAQFELGDRVIFNGTDYEVRTVERLFDGRGLHHLEIGLM